MLLPDSIVSWELQCNVILHCITSCTLENFHLQCSSMFSLVYYGFCLVFTILCYGFYFLLTIFLAIAPLRGGTLLLTTKLSSILSFLKKVAPDYFSILKYCRKFWCDVLRNLIPLVQFKNVKNTLGGMLLLVKIKVFSLQLYWK